MNIERGWDKLIGAKAALYGIARGIIFVFGKGGSCIGLWWILFWIILEKGYTG